MRKKHVLLLKEKYRIVKYLFFFFYIVCFFKLLWNKIQTDQVGLNWKKIFKQHYEMREIIEYLILTLDKILVLLIVMLWNLNHGDMVNSSYVYFIFICTVCVCLYSFIVMCVCVGMCTINVKLKVFWRLTKQENLTDDGG